MQQDNEWRRQPKTIVYTVNYASVGVLFSTTLYIRSMLKLDSIKAALFAVFYIGSRVHSRVICMYTAKSYIANREGVAFYCKESNFAPRYWCMSTAAKCIYVSHSAMYDFVITGVVIESVPVGQISRSLDFVARICCDVVVDPIATQRRDKVNLLSEEDICDIFRPHHSIMDVKFFY